MALPLIWFYISQRTLSAVIGNASSSAHLSCGVPQGSNLGPLLFSICMIPLGQVSHNHNIQFHRDADDTQFYVPLTSSNSTSLVFLSACLADIQRFMSSDNLLQRSADKSGAVLSFSSSDLISSTVLALLQ